MNTLSNIIPAPLLRHLGAHSRLNSLLELPEMAGIDVADVRQSLSQDSYVVNLGNHGLSLTLQCINSDSLPSEQKWGLQGINVNAVKRQGIGPDAPAAYEMTSGDVLQLFGVKADDELVMHMHPLLCFSAEGIDQQAWGVTAVLDESSKKLQTLSLLRVGEWRMLLDPLITEAAIPPTPRTVGAPDRVTCHSSETAPRDGIWEGRLPPGHPQAPLYNDSPHRFLYKRGGDAMASLGLPPVDEAMVLWTWHRDR